MTTDSSGPNATANATPGGATDSPDPDSPPRYSRVITRGRPFEPGNPGRPKGARHKATVMLEEMFTGEAGEIGRKTVELAKEGTFGAIKLILDRTYPKVRTRRIEGF